jgi:hypothetical protein
MTDLRGRAFVALAALLVAGCGSAAVDHSQHSVFTGSGVATRPQVQTPAELANQLLNEARVPANAVRSATPPTKSLRQPPEGFGGSGIVARYRWWRINLPLAAAYSWIAHHQSASLSSAGSSSSSGPTSGDLEQDADFAPPHLPSSANSALLSIAVVPLTARTSAIGAYAVVVRQPARTVSEDVPATVDSVTVITRRTTGEPDAGQVLGRTTVTGASARRLVHDFDALTVQPPGEHFSCPMSFVTQTAIFSAGSHQWTATAGVCVGITVNLDGHQLPTLDSSAAFTHDLRAAYGHRFPRLLGPQPMTAS